MSNDSWQTTLTTKRTLHAQRAWLKLPAFAALPIVKRKKKPSVTDQYWETISLLKGHMALENPEISDEEALQYVLRRVPMLGPDDAAPVMGYPVRESVAIELDDYREEWMSGRELDEEDAETERNDEVWYQRSKGKLAIDFSNAGITPAEIAAVDYLLSNERLVLERVLEALVTHLAECGDKLFEKQPELDYIQSRYTCLRILSLDEATDDVGRLQFCFAIPDNEDETWLQATVHRDRVERVVDAGTSEEQPDSPSWTHPEMGRFSQANGWRKKIVLPEYGAFSYIDDRCGDEIVFALLDRDAHPDDVDKPSEGACDVLDDFWRHRPSVAEICDYVWSVDAAWIRAMNWGAEETPPESAEDLTQHLRLQAVSADYCEEVTAEPSPTTMVNPFTGETIPLAPKEKGIPRPGFWAVELAFNAAFEEEHGYALLWHRGRFVGTGTLADGAEPDKDYDPRA